MPGLISSTGALEDMAILCPTHDDVMRHAKNYIQSLKVLEPQPSLPWQFPRDEKKASIYAYLSSQHEALPRLGVGALKGHFDLQSPLLDELKVFISKI